MNSHTFGHITLVYKYPCLKPIILNARI